MEYPNPWPLRNLVLRTPRLELRPDDDAGLMELVEQAHRGVHPPEEMPFSSAWTDAPRDELGTRMLQHHWKSRSILQPDSWRINFLVRLNGTVIGTQGCGTDNFAVTQEVHTGSWVGLRHQGQGYGTEIRHAMLMFAFDHLGATQARSDAFTDNSASRAVSRKLGYLENGTVRKVRRGEKADVIRLLVSRDRYADYRPEWTLKVQGLSSCLGSLGAARH